VKKWVGKMKKILFITLVFWAVAPLAMAAHGKHKGAGENDGGEDSQWYLGVGTGLSIPVQNWNPVYYLGGGGNFFLGYYLGRDWALQCGLEQWYYTGAGLTTADLRVLPELKWTPGPGEVKPYFFAGPGLDFQKDYPGAASSANISALLGAGLEFELGPKYRLFVEGKLEFIFAAGSTAGDLPLLAGINADL
jgi:hypothetical protein